MLFVRPIRMSDHEDIMRLAREAGTGMTSLPQDADVMEMKLAHAVASFEAKLERPHEESFLFVMEDSETKEVIGSCGIATHIGMSRPFYSYKISTLVQASDELGVYSQQRVLHMVNDYTGVSEIGSLFLMPDHRRDGIGQLLSRCRYLMLAEFPELFSDIVISEIRGVQDEHGDSPFYRHLGQHFFHVEFKKADYTNAIKGSQFIADLMPKYPIYVGMLAKEAQDVIGVPFSASRAAKKLLEKEGFRHQDYIDVFDAGPTMEAERSQIRTIKESRRAPIAAICDTVEGKKMMVSNCFLNNFRMCLTPLAVDENGVTLSSEAAGALQISTGDAVRYAPF